MATSVITKQLNVYRVGGFVRDKLLGIPASDCDYVVVGSSCHEMLHLGFKQIGKFFPVFLHPDTHEEYALARTERKTGSGHTGFSVECSATVTLLEDLSRRDITINAIAEDQNGNLIDPFGGIADLQQHIIRHVSEAFADDPLRILRVARFAAKLNFTVANETLHLLTQMAQTREGVSLSRERIFGELDKALTYKYSGRFFTTLLITDNLAVFFPSLAKLAENPQTFTALINNLNSQNIKHAKYMLIAIHLAVFNLPQKLEEFSLNKNTQKFIRITQILYQMLDHNNIQRKITKENNLDNNMSQDNNIKQSNISDEELLAYYKQLDIWRNFNRFEEVGCYYLNWLKQSQQTKHYTALLNYITIAKALKQLQLHELEDTAINKADIAKLVYKLQLKTIHKIRGQHANSALHSSN